MTSSCSTSPWPPPLIFPRLSPFSRSLGTPGRYEALKALVALVKDRSEKVVEAAVWAIDALDWTAFLEPGERVVLGGPVLKKQEKFMGSVNTKQVWGGAADAAVASLLAPPRAAAACECECQLTRVPTDASERAS